MRLLVSVRNGAEVTRALEGGADIIDAKEPARGSLGAVDFATLSEIAGVLPPGGPLSVALGDLGGSQEVAAAVSALRVGEVRTAFLKLGFAGVASESRVRLAIGSAVAVASSLPGCPQVVAVAYADHAAAASPDPAMLAALGAEAGASGVLLDTWTKDGRDLFAWISPSTLKEWVGEVQRLGLTAAVAGSIRADSIPTVLRTKPDIVGVRGAACTGGRLGSVSASRVRDIRAAMAAGLMVVSTTT